MALGQAVGIRFSEWDFSEPELLPSDGGLLAQLLPQPGVYAVLAHDARCSPRPYRPLYFGESDNVFARATGKHEKFDCWRVEAGAFGLIYRALLPIPGSTKTQRQEVESFLIARYQPACNQRLSYGLESLLSRR